MNVARLAEVIIDVVFWHHNFPDFIVIDRCLLFTPKFWSSLCCFLEIKQKLSTIFHSQTYIQTKSQNSTMEAYLWAFINIWQNDWTKLLLLAEFAYNNAKIASTGYISFELNCRYYLCISYKKVVDLCSKSKLADKLLKEFRDLMTVYRKNLHYT